MAEPGEKREEDTKKILHTYPLIRNSDMADEIRTEAMELCVTACEKHAANNEAAARMIKEMMDKKFGPSWHAIVGEGYGFEISYECVQGSSGGSGSALQHCYGAPSLTSKFWGSDGALVECYNADPGPPYLSHTPKTVQAAPVISYKLSK